MNIKKRSTAVVTKHVFHFDLSKESFSSKNLQALQFYLGWKIKAKTPGVHFFPSFMSAKLTQHALVWFQFCINYKKKKLCCSLTCFLCLAPPKARCFCSLSNSLDRSMFWIKSETYITYCPISSITSSQLQKLNTKP